MNHKACKITLDQWDKQYKLLCGNGIKQPDYGGTLRRHVEDGDTRLCTLQFDNSAASLRLWNFLLTENERLHKARANGKKIIGTMKDLGTIPIMVYALQNTIAFYPDGAWWTPCIMETNEGLFKIADSLGIDESFCPVRAMLGAFLNGEHFPVPDMLICSTGAVCDDFSAISQRLESLGFKINWWEMPHRRKADKNETGINLPGGFSVPATQVEFIKSELENLRSLLEALTGEKLSNQKLAEGISQANIVRNLLAELRRTVFTAEINPLPALEMLIAEMLAIHFCSDIGETILVLQDLLKEAQRRIANKDGISNKDAAKIFWVNPVADLKAMNLLEECGGRVCGTDYLFTHALDAIPTNLAPIEALAQMALADPMAGSSFDRAARICRDIEKFGSEAVIISRIPGASHCAIEGMIIADVVKQRLGIPAIEIEIPSLSDGLHQVIKNRIDTLIEVVLQRRQK
jgi:benzoyl-CoA reductase/2-hydroxyglutaryl-CoA dehydratase subunit BcrC/BadD/HgdB